MKRTENTDMQAQDNDNNKPISNEPPMMTIAYKYGLLNPLDWDFDCEDELRKQTDFWNTLVKIEHNFQQSILDTYCQDEEFSKINKKIEGFNKQLDEVYAERRRLRKQARAKIDTPDLDNKIKELRTQRNKLFSERSPLFRIVRKKYENEINELRDQRYKNLTIARQTSGLWWPNYNAVMASFDVACGKLGPGESVRPHEYNSEGRLSVQIQGGVASEILFVKDKWPAALNSVRIEEFPKDHKLMQLKHWRCIPCNKWFPPQVTECQSCHKPRQTGKKWEKKSLYKLVMTVYTKEKGLRRNVSWPLVLSRPFPEQSTVKQVVINRRRIGHRDGLPLDLTKPAPSYSLYGVGDWEWSVSFVLRTPAPVPTENSSSCGIDIGWRMMENGLRIATIVNERNGVEHIILPQRWLDERDRCDSMFGHTRDEFNFMLLKVADNKNLFLRSPEPMRQIVQTILDANTRVTDTDLANLVKIWATQFPTWQVSMLEEFREWEHDNWIKTEHAGFRRLNLERERLHLYRVAAKKIAQAYGRVGVDGSNLAEIAKLKEGRANLPKPTRKMRTRAATHVFMNEVVRAVTMAGGEFHKVLGSTTVTCMYCGHENKISPDKRIDLIWRCLHCKELWDQDINAATNILKALKTQISKNIQVEGEDEEKKSKRARITRRKVKSEEGDTVS